jgi:hypothetical protein
MSYKTIDFHIRGVAPLLMHNGQLANPLNPFTKAIKAITAKKKKTDEDYTEVARLEIFGGLYVDDQGRPVLPGEVIEGTIVSGARKTKKGKDALSAIIVDGNFPLIYDGPKTPETLWEDKRFHYTVGVTVGQSCVMRTRPIFKSWECKFTVHYLDEVFNPQEVIDFVETAGRVAGLGDRRPKFGRFEVVAAA